MPHMRATQATLPGARGLGALGVRISLRGRLPCSVQVASFALQAPRRHLRAAPHPPSARVARYGGVSAPQGAGASLVSRRARRGACCGRACAAVGRPRPNPLLAPRRPRARARAAPAAPHTPPSSRLKRRRARGEAARRAATPPARLGLSEAFPRPWQPGKEIPTTSQLGQRRAGRAWRPARGRGAVRCELRGMVAGGGRHRSETKTLKCAPGCLKGCQGDQMQYLQKTPPLGEVKGTLQGRRRAVRRRARRSVGVV